MSYEFELKPHGTFPPRPERGAYIEREPKGDPDVILFAGEDGMASLYDAANILSVMGYTARIVRVHSIEKFECQPAEYRNSVFHDGSNILIGAAADDAEEASFRKYTDTVLKPDKSVISKEARKQIIG